MKTTIVPAQITTVEDRIAGNLTFSQILLLIAPLITSSAAFIALAPRSHLTPFKLVFIIVQIFLFGCLAVRINGKIVADWLAIFMKFSRRPRLYLFTKKDLSGRDIVFEEPEPATVIVQPAKKSNPRRMRLSLPDQLRIAKLLRDSSLSVSFELAKKGGVNVSLKPAKE